MRDDRSGLMAGLVLITIGTIFLVEQQGWVHGWGMGQLWPLILIVVGALRLANPRPDRHRWGGFWILLTGVLFLLDSTRILAFGRSWPLFIVAGGIAVLLGRGERVGNDPTPPTPPEAR